MNDEKEFCQICFEKFNLNTHTPKIMSCCKNVICLNCIKSIYEVQQITLCPICRNNQKIIAAQLQTDMTVFEGFLQCPHCCQKVIKSELYYSFDSQSIKCIKCQSNEMGLLEYVTMMYDDLNIFLHDYPTISNNCLIDLLSSKIEAKLDLFFNSMKKQLMNTFTTRIAKEINSKLGFDLQKNVMLFKENIDRLNVYLSNMNTFINESGVKKVPIDILLSDIKNYSLHKEEVIEQSFPFDRIKKYINENKLFSLRKEISEKEVNSFMVNIFETDFSDKLDLDHKTGITYFDSYTTKLLKENKVKEAEENMQELIEVKDIKNDIYDFEFVPEDILQANNNKTVQNQLYISNTIGNNKQEKDNEENKKEYHSITDINKLISEIDEINELITKKNTK